MPELLVNRKYWDTGPASKHKLIAFFFICPWTKLKFMSQKGVKFQFSPWANEKKCY